MKLSRPVLIVKRPGNEGITETACQRRSAVRKRANGRLPLPELTLRRSEIGMTAPGQILPLSEVTRSWSAMIPKVN